MSLAENTASCRRAAHQRHPESPRSPPAAKPTQTIVSAVSSLFQGRRSNLTAPPVSPLTPQDDGEIGTGRDPNDSPLLAHGHVVNADTGRLVKLEGSTCQALLRQGYVLDRAKGEVRPPDTSPELQPSAESPEQRGRSPLGQQQRSGYGGAQGRGSGAGGRRRSSRRSNPAGGFGGPAGSTQTTPW